MGSKSHERTGRKTNSTVQEVGDHLLKPSAQDTCDTEGRLKQGDFVENMRVTGRRLRSDLNESGHSPAFVCTGDSTWINAESVFCTIV